jgi:hypothetical protein
MSTGTQGAVLRDQVRHDNLSVAKRRSMSATAHEVLGKIVSH